MQTYTHALVGVAGALAITDSPWAGMAFTAASVAPDLTMIPQYALDLFAGRKPLTEQSSRLMLLKEVAHSIPIAATVWLLSALFDPLHIVGAFGSGWVLHCVIDACTHGTGRKSKFWDTDVTFLWPLNLLHANFDLRPFGLWEYRYDFGALRPKPFEALTDIALILAILIYIAS